MATISYFQSILVLQEHSDSYYADCINVPLWVDQINPVRVIVHCDFLT